MLQGRLYHHYHHHQFLTPATWRRWVRINDLHCPRSLVKSIAPLSVSPSDVMSSFIYIVYPALSGLPLCLFPSNPACSTLCRIRSTGTLSTCPNHQSLWLFVTRLSLAGLYTCRLNLPPGVRTLEETRIIVCRLLTRFIFHLKKTESRKIPENAQCNEIRIAVDKTVRATKDLLYTIYIHYIYTIYTIYI